MSVETINELQDLHLQVVRNLEKNACLTDKDRYNNVMK